MHSLATVTSGIEPIDREWRQKARNRLNNLAVPRGSLGQLLNLAEQLVAIKQTLTPRVDRRVVVTMAGDHGVVREGVSAFPQAVTPQMVYNFVAGGAAINVLANVAGARVIVVDMGVAAPLDDLAQQQKIISCKVALGTRNMTEGPAMTRKQAVQTLERGISIVGQLAREGLDLLATGDMGIGNTTPSSAILAVLAGLPVREVTGRGTGINDAMLENKVRVIERAISLNEPDANDPLDVLAKVGGLEIGGIAGLFLGAAYFKIPILVDGFISSAGALLAQAFAPASVDYMIAAHLSREHGHHLMLDVLGLRPLLDLDLHLGEGTGGALAMKLVEAAAEVVGKMLSFDDAGVSRSGQGFQIP